LLLAAIEAVPGLRPHDAHEVLAHLADADDEEIADAVYEALSAAGPDEDDELDEDEEGEDEDEGDEDDDVRH